MTVALAGTLTSAVPKPAAMGSAFFGSFSYMLIFAIAAGNYNGEASVDSDCGNGGSDNDNLSYGAAFALAIVNWLFLAVAGVLIMMDKDDKQVGAN